MNEASRLYVGIDVSRDSLDACFLDKDRRAVRQGLSYSNDPDGHTALCTAIVSAARLVNESEPVLCGMESTGNMHVAIANRLRAERRRAIEVCVLNPAGPKHFAKAKLSDKKTDAYDSRLLAEYLIAMKPQPTRERGEQIEELLRATRRRREWVEDRTDSKNRIHDYLRVHFPGYRSVIGSELTMQMLAVLHAYPSPQAILAASIDDLCTLPTGERGHVRRSFAERFQLLAEQAPAPGPAPTDTLAVVEEIKRIEGANKSINAIEHAIEDLLDRIYPKHPVRTIPGVGPVTAATVVAEVGDVTRFCDEKHFIGYTGLYPITWESGTAKRKYRMTYKGNRGLKTALLVASAPARQYNPAVSAYYERLRARGKSKKAAGGAAARKLAAIIYAVLVSNQEWSAEIARNGMNRGAQMAAARTSDANTGNNGPTEEVRTPGVPVPPNSRSEAPRTTTIHEEDADAQPRLYDPIQTRA